MQFLLFCIFKLTAIALMNMLQAEIYEWAFTLLGMVGSAGIVMLISSAATISVGYYFCAGWYCVYAICRKEMIKKD